MTSERGEQECCEAVWGHTLSPQDGYQRNEYSQTSWQSKRHTMRVNVGVQVYQYQALSYKYLCPTN